MILHTFERPYRYRADVLGETQWAWLEAVLTGTAPESGGHERPDLTVVVSSVQVMTSNPLVESWGHFPKARSRYDVDACSFCFVVELSLSIVFMDELTHHRCFSQSSFVAALTDHLFSVLLPLP